MLEWLAALALLAATIGGVVAALRAARLRRIARERLATPTEAVAERSPAAPETPFARRHYFAPWLAAAAVLGLLTLATPLPLPFAAAFAVLVGLLGGQLDAVWLARRQSQIESQLADAIDLMVAAIRVGASLQAALESALSDARRPLRPQLEEVLGRIRYGDEPRDAFDGLARRVPLETFRLLATTLAVNWQVGGSLATTLASVGRTIRDRIELSRRLQSITMQARASIVSILLVTYFIAALMWRNDPERMVGFLSSSVGQALAVAAIVAQGVGIVWISLLIKPRF